MDAPECLGAFEMKRSAFQDDECVFGLTCKPTNSMLLNTTSLHLCDQFIWISVYDFMFFFFLSEEIVSSTYEMFFSYCRNIDKFSERNISNHRKDVRT